MRPRRRRSLAVAAAVLLALVSPVQAQERGERAADEVRDAGSPEARTMALARLLDGLRGVSLRQRLEDVNRFFNGFRHRADREAWGREDYWATLPEFLRLGAGDCEDFAIAKYFALRALDVPDRDLAVVYARDLRRGLPHMVLLHGAPGDGAALVLDNHEPDPRPAGTRGDLLPVFALNAGPVRVAVAGPGPQRTWRAVGWRHRVWDRVLALTWEAPRLARIMPAKRAQAPLAQAPLAHLGTWRRGAWALPAAETLRLVRHPPR